MNATLDALRDQLTARLMADLVARDAASLTPPQFRQFLAERTDAALAELDPSALAAFADASRPAAVAPPAHAAPGPSRTFPLVPLALTVAVLAFLYLFAQSVLALGPVAPGPGRPAIAPPVQPRAEGAPAAAPGKPQPLVGPDGAAFEAQKTFRGDTTGQPYEVSFGTVAVSDGQLKVLISGLPGHDGVFDYLRLQNQAAGNLKFEAEDAGVVGGDAYSDNDGLEDGHWWLQSFGAFSGGKGLVIRKNERMPVLTCVLRAADGEYELSVGSFKGDPPNGVFGLGVTVR
jgi:hypothetical protein